MSFFGVNVNPFSTPVGQRIEHATDGSLPSENWALNMGICDIVNDTEDGPRDAIKAIKRRLNQAASKNYTVVMYTLIVLETCVKNCGKRFHALAFSRDFVQELLKIIGPKNEPPAVVQDKVLSLIRTWAETFHHQPYAQGVCQVYQELKAKGMQFPITDLDAMAPIITPERSVPETDQPSVGSAQAVGMGHPQVQGQPTQIAAGQMIDDSAAGLDAAVHQPHQQIHQPQSGPQSGNVGIAAGAVQPLGTPLHEQLLTKLKSELDVVRGNMRVLSEMLAHLTAPEQTTGNRQPEQADIELLEQLYGTCKAMQERVVELIARLVDDEMTAELLRINDELNNLFLRYSRYTKNKVGGQGSAAASAILAQTIGHPPIVTEVTAGGNKRTEADSLIDLSDGIEPVVAQMADIGISADGPATRETPSTAHRRDKELDSDEFDMFAQSRNATYETTKNSGSKYEDNMEQVSEGLGLSTAILNRGNAKAIQQQSSSASAAVAAANPNRESEFNEMAAWLDHTPGNRGDPESLTSSEFERFLAERAAAAEALPTLPTVTAAPSVVNGATSTSTSAANPNIQRQINKDQDKSLFAL